MPGMNKTGPFGTGPIGRGMGPCGDGKASRGRGHGFWQGSDTGWGRMTTALSQDEEREILEKQKIWLETQLTAITQRLQALVKP